MAAQKHTAIQKWKNT